MLEPFNKPACHGHPGLDTGLDTGLRGSYAGRMGWAGLAHRAGSWTVLSLFIFSVLFRRLLAYDEEAAVCDSLEASQ